MKLTSQLTKLNVHDKFNAHISMCGHVTALGMAIVDHSFRGRHNYFLLEDADGQRVILYVFVVCLDDDGYRMKFVYEDQYIPDNSCPERMLRGSTCKEESAVAWRNNMLSVMEMKRLERMASEYAVRKHKEIEVSDAEDKVVAA